MSDLYEIVEIAEGEIVLRRADEDGEPLVSISFSDEALYFLNNHRFSVAKAMIEAGLEAANAEEDATTTDEDELGLSSMLH